MNGRFSGPAHEYPDQPGHGPGPIPRAGHRGTYQGYGPPADYRIWVIVVTAVGALFSVIAGLPAALVAVHYSRRVRRSWGASDERGAAAASRSALTWVIASACLDAAGVIVVSVMISQGGHPAGWM
jgi:Interferon-induced transmembrane protein